MIEVEGAIGSRIRLIGSMKVKRVGITFSVLPETGLPPSLRIRLLGVPIDALLLPDLLGRVFAAVEARAAIAVLYVNIHCMNVAGRDADYKKLLNDAELVYCDGTGVRLGADLAGMYLPARMTGADWIHDLARQMVRRGNSLFLVAGSPGVAATAAVALQVRHPGLKIVGTASGYDPGTDTLEAIAASRPDILLVGMGTPTQEKWIGLHRNELEVPVVWAVGALFDFVSGKLPRGPRVLTDHGFEWLCRLVVEPRKLWRRYLIGNPLFFLRIVRAYGLHPRTRHKHPPSTEDKRAE